MNHWIIAPVILPALLAPVIGFVMRHDLPLARTASVAGTVALLVIAIGLVDAQDERNSWRALWAAVLARGSWFAHALAARQGRRHLLHGFLLFSSPDFERQTAIEALPQLLLKALHCLLGGRPGISGDAQCDEDGQGRFLECREGLGD